MPRRAPNPPGSSRLRGQRGPRTFRAYLHFARDDVSSTRAQIDPTKWVRVLTRYGVPDYKRSVLELLATIVPYFALWEQLVPFRALGKLPA